MPDQEESTSHTRSGLEAEKPPCKCPYLAHTWGFVSPMNCANCGGHCFAYNSHEGEFS